jgi:adenylate cyclase class 2
MEVEQKFPVENLAEVEARLKAAGIAVSGVQFEADVYFAHPARDFARTDEALRIRRAGSSVFITYKGPKIDATTKTRREIDLRLPGGDPPPEAWSDLLAALGFRPVAEVRKRRRKAHADWEGRRVEISLDDVDEVGTFVELELVTDPTDVEAAKAVLASLAKHLALSQSERRSYLELLLARRGSGTEPGRFGS